MASGRGKRGKPTRNQPIGKDQAIAERRVEVFRRLRNGQAQADIARELGMHRQLVSRDVAVMMGELHDEALGDAKAYQALARARLEALYVTYADKALGGDLDSARFCLNVNDRWIRLMGADAPQKVEHSGADGMPLIDVKLIQAVVMKHEGGE